MNQTKKFCDLQEFRDTYNTNIGYFSFLVCIFGSISNFLNILVLKRKTMWSPTNFILMGIAIADLFLMLEYTVFTYHRNISYYRKHVSNFTKPWAVFMQFHAIVTQILHFISCYLNVMLAIWRYVYISRQARNTLCSSFFSTTSVIIAIYLICPIICIPILFSTEIRNATQVTKSDGYMILEYERMKENNTDEQYHNETIYVIQEASSFYLSVWIYTVLLKIFPCVFLTAVTYKIISILSETKKRRRRLLSPSPAEILNGKTKRNNIQIYKEHQADRTTKMLIVVLILFLATEFPQTIFGLLFFVYGVDVIVSCYIPLGDILDILSLTNCAINFILYCTMSRQFRVEFVELFKMKCFSRRSVTHPIPEDHSPENAETKMSLV